MISLREMCQLILTISLDLHHHSTVMKKILDLREKYDLHMRVERYVSDEAGIPERDKTFIKE